MDRAQIIKQLQAQPNDPVIEGLREWIAREDTQITSAPEVDLRVSEAKRLWTVRLENTNITGRSLQGAELLLDKLDRLSPQSRLEQFAFTTPQASGNLFFLYTNHAFVGAVVVGR